MSNEPNGGGEQSNATAEEGAPQDTVATENQGATTESKEQQKGEANGSSGTPDENLSSYDLLSEIEPEKPEAKPAATQPPEKDRERGQLEYELAFKAAMKRVLNADDIDEAISKEKDHIQGKLRKIALGDTDATGPEVQGKQNLDTYEVARQAYADIRDQEKFNDLYPQICETAGIAKNTAHAITLRKALLAETQRLVKYKMPKAEAVELAAAKLGLYESKKLEEARRAGAKAGRTTLPSAGNPPKVPKSTSTDVFANVDNMTAQEIMAIAEGKR